MIQKFAVPTVLNYVHVRTCVSIEHFEIGCCL